MSDYESTLEYCTNQDVKNYMPPAARKSNLIDSEINIWKPLGQAMIEDLLEDKFITPLEGASTTLTTDNMPKKVRFASALMTVSLLLVNAFTEHNYQVESGDKVINLSQIKESQAKKLIKDFAHKRSYYDTRLKEQLGTSTLAKVIKSFQSDERDNVTDYITEVNTFYT